MEKADELGDGNLLGPCVPFEVALLVGFMEEGLREIEPKQIIPKHFSSMLKSVSQKFLKELFIL
jgi:hypothetical protein